jgi:hypothetical protein
MQLLGNGLDRRAVEQHLPGCHSPDDTRKVFWSGKHLRTRRCDRRKAADAVRAANAATARTEAVRGKHNPFSDAETSDSLTACINIRFLGNLGKMNRNFLLEIRFSFSYGKKFVLNRSGEYAR